MAVVEARRANRRWAMEISFCLADELPLWPFGPDRDRGHRGSACAGAYITNRIIIECVCVGGGVRGRKEYSRQGRGFLSYTQHTRRKKKRKREKERERERPPFSSTMGIDTRKQKTDWLTVRKTRTCTINISKPRTLISLIFV